MNKHTGYIVTWYYSIPGGADVRYWQSDAREGTKSTHEANVFYHREEAEAIARQYHNGTIQEVTMDA